VTAVASFYFGSQVAAGAKPKVETAPAGGSTTQKPDGGLDAAKKPNGGANSPQIPDGGTQAGDKAH
jgi:hypothetical protein